MSGQHTLEQESIRRARLPQGAFPAALVDRFDVILCTTILLAFVACPHAPFGQPLPGSMVDVALGKPYTLNPRPNYPLTADPGDVVQLTDGAHASGGFWTDKAAVGWVNAKPVSITIDLGTEFELEGATFSAAAGTRGDVEWPSAVLVLGSLDGLSFRLLGDLVAQGDRSQKAPGPGRFARHVFATRELEGRARFVRLLVDSSGPYVFVDEVELFGHLAVASTPLPDGTADTDALFWREHAAARLRAEVDRRLLDAEQRIDALRIAGSERNALLADLRVLQRVAARLTADDWAAAGTQYPMNDSHAAALAMLGRLEQLDGSPALRVWPTNPWDSLDLTTRPAPGEPASVEVAVMNGEHRSAALNLRNSTAAPITATLSLAEVDAPEPGYVEARTVAWTGDAQGRPVALALLPPASTAGVAIITVPAGVTRQLWLTFSPTRVHPGVHGSAIRVSAPGVPDLSVPVTVRILPGHFPARPRLHLGGWDYLDSGGPIASSALRTEIAALLRTFGVDLPWATATVMPFGKYDAEGRMIEPPNPAAFDAWVALWPKASRYRVYLSARDVLAAVRRGTPAFSVAVRGWALFWSAHLAKLGIPPSDVELLFVDEPHGEPGQTERQVAWARALRDAGSGFRVWLNPVYSSPNETPLGLVDTADTLCLNRRLVEDSAGPYRAFARRLRSAGKAVELFGTAGPSSLLDSYAYYRLLSWRAFDVGATAIGVWSFTDTGRGSSWREYQAPRTVYSPLFVDGHAVAPGKHLYAIREGIQDFEYLAMLEDAIVSATLARKNDALASEARALRDSSLQRVLAASRLTAYSWNVAKDRSAADVERVKIAEVLARLNR